MREILFRGKSEDDGEWLFGDLFHRNREVLIKNHFEGFNISVVPKTVGQYTGLNDKNGTKIFEGDIVKYIIGKGEYEFAEFEYGEINYRNVGFEIDGESCDLCVCSFDSQDFNLEVVGNIHDNPELLKERKND